MGLSWTDNSKPAVRGSFWTAGRPAIAATAWLGCDPATGLRFAEIKALMMGFWLEECDGKRGLLVFETPEHAIAYCEKKWAERCAREAV